MRAIVAMDSFKGSLSASEACQAVADGLRAASAAFDVDLMPIADGGEGFLDVLADATGGERVSGACHDPLGRVMSAPFLRTPDGVAVIEMAAASGLTLLTPAERDIMRATTYGTGEQLMDALRGGAKRICLGLGGSATCDGGLGLMRALGMKFCDGAGREVTTPEELERLEHVDASELDARLMRCDRQAACDVDSPLTGPLGAAHVFGPQKGAGPAEVERLDAALARLSRCMRAAGFDMEGPGAGAAGGLGGALKALGFELRPGVDMVLELTHARARIARAELAIVGEGMTDSQTAAGKAPCGVARLAAELGRATVCISGGLGDDYPALYEHGFTAAFSAVARPMSVECAIGNAREYLFNRARDVGRLWVAARWLSGYNV